MSDPGALAARVGGAEVVRAAFDRRRAARRHLREHRSDLMARYTEQWVAITDSGVLAAASTLEELREPLEASGVPLGAVVLHYFTATPQVDFL